MSQDNAGHQIGDISVMYKSMKEATLNGFNTSFHFKQNHFKDQIPKKCLSTRMN